ncbi:hypothetical protein GOB19_33340, partial [Sinorhizobium meliloti]|nr:hypothetical protein [Sinorhizobium meliloti]MDX0017744.1 hypothetical protein [Sinorhizobium meliloti]MDX0166703.1 hypothetical protein [Sinorhizobium meliloti]MDX0216407.1 hypothetical protein [Sinorhizobium meliloti]
VFRTRTCSDLVRTFHPTLTTTALYRNSFRASAAHFRRRTPGGADQVDVDGSFSGFGTAPPSACPARWLSAFF